MLAYFIDKKKLTNNFEGYSMIYTPSRIVMAKYFKFERRIVYESKDYSPCIFNEYHIFVIMLNLRVRTYRV